MNLLITGGTGLIGTRFIHRHPGHHYTVLTRSTHLLSTPPSDATRYIGDLSELASLDGFDAVINLAGEPIIDKRWSVQQKRIICDSRWHITQQIVDKIAASSHPPRVFISGSAVGIYGDAGEVMLNEASLIPCDDFAHQLCERWETIAAQAASYTRVVHLRTGIVLDAQGGALAKMRLPFSLCLGGHLGSGRQFMSWIHIDDMVAAILFLLMNEHCHGAFNLTSPQPVTNQQFTRALASALHRFAILPVPGAILSLLMGESSQLLLGSQRVYPDKLLQAGFQFSYPSIQEALNQLLTHSG
ncbi:MAG: TIGR01777 family protein [Hahellaceae bacterium]|nr:TIGR01777 family protein [Hahellaceae bacterium]MCP5169823.1 TIGR01777 family protein [Hahellaceae bacterium]